MRRRFLKAVILMAVSGMQARGKIQDLEGDWDGARRRWEGAVVRVRVETPPEAPGPPSKRASGVLWGDLGRVVTAARLVGNASSVFVEFRDGSERPATLLRQEPELNLAVLRVNGPLPECAQPIVEVSSPRRKEGILFCGSAERHLESYRIHIPLTERGAQIERRLPLRANGGLVIDLQGRPMGVATLIGTPAPPQIQQRQGSGGGFSFRVVRADQFPLAGSLGAEEAPSQEWAGGEQAPYVGASSYKPWLGASVQKVDEELSESMGMSQPGLLVASVKEGGPANKGGLQMGDVITGANGVPVREVADLKTILQKISPGSSLVLDVADGESGEGKEVIVERPDETS